MASVPIAGAGNMDALEQPRRRAGPLSMLQHALLGPGTLRATLGFLYLLHHCNLK